MAPGASKAMYSVCERLPTHRQASGSPWSLEVRPEDVSGCEEKSQWDKVQSVSGRHKQDQLRPHLFFLAGMEPFYTAHYLSNYLDQWWQQSAFSQLHSAPCSLLNSDKFMLFSTKSALCIVWTWVTWAGLEAVDLRTSKRPWTLQRLYRNV